VPLLVEWPDGRREAVLFVLEHETDTCNFSIHRFAHCCLDLAEPFTIERVVPVAITLRQCQRPEELILGGDTHRYLAFRYLACAPPDLPRQGLARQRRRRCPPQLPQRALRSERARRCPRPRAAPADAAGPRS